MPAIQCWLNSITTEGGIILDGLEFLPESPKAAVVHVHGSLGNFYHQPFLRQFGQLWRKEGIALLSYNLRTHDGISEAYRLDGDMEYVGGSITRFETCVEDIDAIVQRAKSISDRVCLQGHSMGCDRVIFYSKGSGSMYPVILLSPCNSRKLQADWLLGEGIQDQVERLKSLREEEDNEITLLPSSEYGIRAPDGWTYTIPVSKDAFLGLAEGPVFSLLDVGRSPTVIGPQPAWVYLGARDPIRGCSVTEMEQHVKSMFPSAACARFQDGGHDLESCSQEVSKALVNWIATLADE